MTKWQQQIFSILKRSTLQGNSLKSATMENLKFSLLSSLHSASLLKKKPARTRMLLKSKHWLTKVVQLRESLSYKHLLSVKKPLETVDWQLFYSLETKNRRVKLVAILIWQIGCVHMTLSTSSWKRKLWLLYLKIWVIITGKVKFALSTIHQTSEWMPTPRKALSLETRETEKWSMWIQNWKIQVMEQQGLRLSVKSTLRLCSLIILLAARIETATWDY